MSVPLLAPLLGSYSLEERKIQKKQIWNYGRGISLTLIDEAVQDSVGKDIWETETTGE